jgi:hypothetical protein
MPRVQQIEHTVGKYDAPPGGTLTRNPLHGLVAI